MFHRRSTHSRHHHAVLQTSSLREVEITRGRFGYGFTLSGQHPCVLNSIAVGSSAERAGLKPGDCVMRVNGLVVTHAAHDDVVRLIGSSSGLLILEIMPSDNSLVDEVDHRSDSSSDDPARGSSRSKLHLPKPQTPGRQNRSQRVNRHGDGNLPVSIANAEPVGKYSLKNHSAKKKLSMRMLDPLRDVSAFVADKYRSRGPGGSSAIMLQQVQQTDRLRQDAQDFQRHGPVGPAATATSHRSMKGRHPSPLRLTKHTIITRDVRLGLRKPLVETELAANANLDDVFSDNNDGDDSVMSIKTKKISDVVRIIVRYAGSVEMLCDPKVANARLQAIRHAVQRLRIAQKVHTMVMMEADNDGIRVVDCMARLLAQYRTTRVAFCGICPDDHRFFGIVTIMLDTDDFLIQRQQPNRPDLNGRCSCHIFMVDPDLCSHHAHAALARRFRMNCTSDVDHNQCAEFPVSSSLVIAAIGRLYRQRRDGFDSSDLVQLGSFQGHAAGHLPRSSTSSSNSESGGLLERSERVFVVDVDRQQRTGGDGAEQVPESLSQSSYGSRLSVVDNSFIHDLSAIQPAAGSMLHETFNQSTASSVSMNVHDLHRSGSDVDPSLSFKRNRESEIRSGPTISQSNISGSSARSKVDVVEDLQCISADQFMSGINHPHSGFEQPHYSGVADIVNTNCSNTSAIGGSAMEGSSNELPPPLPPRQSVVSRSSSTATVFQNCSVIPPPIPRPSAQSIGRSSSPTLPINPLRKSTVGPLRTFQEINSQFSASKPPLPERRPVLPRLIPRNPVFPPDPPPLPPTRKPDGGTRQERSKSTPPLRIATTTKDMSLSAASNDDARFSSDQSEVSSGDDIGDGLRRDFDHLSGGTTGDSTGLMGEDARRLSDGGQGGAGNGLSDRNHSTMNKVGGVQSAVSCKGLSNISTIGREIGRAASWAILFDRLLHDKAGLATFTEFLQKEFSQENIIFWCKCEEFKKISSAEQRKTRATEIYSVHLDSSATDPINIDETTRLAVEKDLPCAASNLFDPAQKHIYMLMKQDSYSRFLKSEIYKQAVIAEMEGRPFPFSGEKDESSTKSKNHADRKLMKKSKSSAMADNATDEKRRRSILPWNRNKMEKKLLKTNTNPEALRHTTLSLTTQSKDNATAPLTGFDSGAGGISKQSSKRFCRVILPDGSQTTLCSNGGQSVGESLNKLGDKLKPGLVFMEVILTDTGETVDIAEDNQVISSREVRIEKRVLFRIDLPAPRPPILVRAQPGRTLYDVLQPILHRVSLDFESSITHVSGTGAILNGDSLVGQLDCKHVVVQTLDSVKKERTSSFGLQLKQLASAAGRPSLPRQRSEPFGLLGSAGIHLLQDLFRDYTACSAVIQPWNGVLQFDELGVCALYKVDYKSKSSEESRSAGLFGFIRRNSLGEKDRAKASPRHNPVINSVVPSGAPSNALDSVDGGTKKDNKFLELLTRSQCRQLDDQRGVSLFGVQIPDFLRTDGESNYNENHASDSANNDQPCGDGYSVDYYNDAAEICRVDCMDEEDWNGEIMSRNENESDDDFNCITPLSWRLDNDSCENSFVCDGVYPSHAAAEAYFTATCATSTSLDFNDPLLMEKSLRDIGMETTDLHSEYPDQTSLSIVKKLNLSPDRQSDSSIFIVPAIPPRQRRHNGDTDDTIMASAGMSSELVRSRSDLRRRLSPNVSNDLTRLSIDAENTDRSISTPLDSSGHKNCRSALHEKKCPAYKDRILESWVRLKQNSSNDSFLISPTTAGSDTNSASTTPSPTTHTLMLVDGDCVISRALPVTVSNELSTPDCSKTYRPDQSCYV